MDYTEAGYKIYGLWCEAGRPGTPEWGVSSIANIIRELDSRGIEPVTQAAPVSPRPKSAAEFWETYPHCIGYPGCDGDLEGTSHEPGCPLFGKKDVSMTDFAEAYAKYCLDSVTLTPSSKEKI